MMSDVEEPPPKITKIDSEADPEAQEDFEGQEEWLSEELLTDDEGITREQDICNSIIGNISQMDSAMEDVSETIPELSNKDDTHEDIEHALNSLDNPNSQELDTFLIKNKDGSVVEAKKLNVNLDDNNGPITKNYDLESSEDEDGNSTDDLLRMLGEEGDKEKKKKIVKKAPQRPKQDESTDDEDVDGVYEDKVSRLTRLRLAQTTLIKKQPAKKAEPEEMSDSSSTSNEAITMKKMFVTKQVTKDSTNNQNNKATSKMQPVKMTPMLQSTKVTPKMQPLKLTPSPPVKVTPKSQPAKATPKFNKASPKEINNENTKIKTSLSYQSPPNSLAPKSQHKASSKKHMSTNLPKRIGNVTITPTSNKETNNRFSNILDLKPDKVASRKTNSTSNMSTKKELNHTKSETAATKTEIKTVNPGLTITKASSKSNKTQPKLGLDEFDEIIDEEEFLEDDDDFGLSELMDDTDNEESKQKLPKQRIMKPEVMDEEIPSDIESASENGSNYDSSGVESAYAAGSMHDEIPSSDYEDESEEWFTLDIRSERAGEYIPLLGPKAYQLLLDEKKRVTSRLESLKKSLSEQRENTRRQKEQLKNASATLAELDAMLVAM